MTAKTNLKARQKAAASRLSTNLRTAKAIIDATIVDNDLLHLADNDELQVAGLPDGDVSVPLEFWLAHKTVLQKRAGLTAVQIGADQDAEALQNELGNIGIVVLPLVTHVDGRPYSIAHKLRQRFGFTGQIRAIGDVKFDQLGFLSRVGCNGFELPEGENLQTALRALQEFSEVYQPAADNSRLIFSRRRATH